MARPLGPALVAIWSLVAGPLRSQPSFTLEQVRSYPFASDLVAATRAPRVAWAFNAQGHRNIWVADGPSWTGRALTRFDRDDGQELSSVRISADGRYVVFVRGGDHGCNWDCGVPVNATSSPVPPVVAIWIVPVDGGAPHQVGDGDTPVINPNSNVVAWVRDGQPWSAPLDGSSPPRRMFATRGVVRELAWSPDGTRLAFVADRGDHAFVGIYANDSTPIQWLAPSTGRDLMPQWSRTGDRVAFVRRPGLGGPPDPVLNPPSQPWRIMVVDVATGMSRTVWKSPATLPGGYPRITGGPALTYAAGGRVVFRSYEDGWPHLYSVSDTGGTPLLLTPGPWMVETFGISPDGRFLVASGNAGDAPNDIDRRHLVRVSVDRADARVITPGTGLEFSPVVAADGATIAWLGATTQRPAMPMVGPAQGGTGRGMADAQLPSGFPVNALVTPRTVTFRAPDGLEIRAQLFERPGGPAKKPAVVFAHGGPERQMLLGFHYMDYYAGAYALNQYLASQGYVVLSVNFRLGIGYGFDFHRIVDGWSRGASEYQDIKAAGEYLRTLSQVDGSRIGIYGGSYGGFLTAMALARNSDLFAVGVNIHGPSDWTADNASRIGGLAWDYEKGDRAAAADVAFQASPVAHVDGWRSPVLFIHGDDDRNTRFYHTIDLVRRLEARGVPYEELVIPDDTHHWMRHANALRVWGATTEFLARYLRPGR
ncbi:MAG: S9 family peptidase [Gemmatimonadetes bacterium]|nr:S9 family peptidase [Gemmatimonadota bacterium]